MVTSSNEKKQNKLIAHTQALMISPPGAQKALGMEQELVQCNVASSKADLDPVETFEEEQISPWGKPCIKKTKHQFNGASTLLFFLLLIIYQWSDIIVKQIYELLLTFKIGTCKMRAYCPLPSQESISLGRIIVKSILLQTDEQSSLWDVSFAFNL